ncbi:ATP-binding protein [Geomonas sp.]|uniref:ATP-binding protein n=1 Tax=Geomonas sp. TaxID=2651584 RepID=UPI002B4A20F7|nr:ATP-binding protein [Geomonas sp.]HJV35294.1 ATP-binding protein [Geomonas sp.]
MKKNSSLSSYMKGFRFRLYLISTATIALLTAAFASIYVITEMNGYRSTLEREGRLLATILAQNARLPLFAENREALSLLASSTARHPSILFVSISNADGKLLTEASNRKADVGDAIDMDIPITSPGAVMSPDAVLLGRAPVDDKRVIGHVHLRLDTSGVREQLKNLLVASLAIGTLFWINVSLLCYQILKRVTYSFKKLLHGIEEIGSGHLSTRVELEGDDELARAANAINAMAASLELRELENLSLQEELLKAMKLEVQEEKKRVMARLIQTNKMTSLGLLLSSMAHEINNPNASIRFSGHMISKIWADVVPVLDRVREEEGDFYLGGVPFQTARTALSDNAVKIVENSERIARVVQGLREYGVGDGSRVRPDFNVNDAVSAALSVLACQMKQNIQLRTSLGSDLPSISGSQQQIEQVLINLIMNAMQALPNACGEVDVTTRYERGSDEVLVEVKDTGAGISPDIMERLFEPFFSTKLDRGGSGLGLYISQFIVAEHGGRLLLSSEPGKGTLARLVIPVKSAPKSLGEVVAAQDEQHAANPVH